MWGSKTVVWTICLACVQPVVFSWILPFRSNRDRPHPALGALTEKVECFSDYMTLKIPKSHVQGLRQWLAAILSLPGTLRAPGHLDALLDECGYLLRRAPEGDFVFRALYSACFVQKEKANYRLEIRVFRKGAKRLEQSDGYIMKCPVIMSRLVQQSVRCSPTFMQVSRPLPPRNEGGQTPWLLSFRGELVASVEDASLMGLDVDINATTITIQHPRQGLLQRQEVRNTSLDLLPLWLVSGYYAYSFEAVCPPVSAQPESEVFLHIPRQRLGLVKRGSHIEEILNPRFLRVHQSSIFTVTKDRDFVVISIPAAGLLQVQPCQGAEGASGTQAFYRVDVSLGFAEAVAPVRWMVENVFQCVGSEEESPASTATLKTAPSSSSSRPETLLAEMQFPVSPWFQNAQLTPEVEPSRDFVHWPAEGKDKQEPEPSLQTSRPAKATWTVTAFLSPKAMQDQDLPETASLSTPRQTSAAHSSEPMGAAQAGAGPSQPVFLTPTALIAQQSSEVSSPPLPAQQSSEVSSPPLPAQQSSEVSSPPLPAWRFDVTKVLLGPGLPVTPTEGLGATRDEQDSAQTPGSPLLLGGLSEGSVVTTKPILGQPARVSEESQPVMRSSGSSVTEEGMSSHHAPGMLQEMSSTETAEGPQQNAGGPFEEGIRGHFHSSSPGASQDTGLTVLLGMDATFTTPRGSQSDASAPLETSEPEASGRPRISQAVSLTALPKNSMASVSKKPEISCAGASDGTPEMESAPKWPEGWHEQRAAHTTSPLLPHALNLWVPKETTVPSLDESGTHFPAGQWASLQLEPMETTFTPSPESPDS